MMPLPRVFTATIIFTSLLPIFGHSLCARTLPRIDLPVSVDQAVIELRDQSLIAAYQIDSDVVVESWNLEAAKTWSIKYTNEYFNSVAVDRSGRTALIRLTPDWEEGFKETVLRDGEPIFSREGKHSLNMSPSGRFFYYATPFGGLTKGLVGEDGEPIPLPNDLDRHVGNYNFVADTHLLIACRELKARPSGMGPSGSLVLLKLPAEVVWATRILPGEFQLISGQEEAIALHEGMLIVGERGGPVGRGQRTYCIDSGGEVRWSIEFSSPLIAVAILNDGLAVVLLSDRVVGVEMESGSVRFSQPTPEQLYHVSSITRGEGKVVLNTLIRPRVSLPMLVELAGDGGVTVEVLGKYTSVRIREDRLVGLQRLRGSDAVSFEDVER